MQLGGANCRFPRCCIRQSDDAERKERVPLHTIVPASSGSVRISVLRVGCLSKSRAGSSADPARVISIGSIDGTCGFPSVSWLAVTVLSSGVLSLTVVCALCALSGCAAGLRVPQFETYAYSASKAALHHLTRVLAVQLAPRNVTVNAIAAGPFESKMMKQTLDQFRDVIESQALLRRIGAPTDVVGVRAVSSPVPFAHD